VGGENVQVREEAGGDCYCYDNVTVLFPVLRVVHINQSGNCETENNV
jgi:hypothetical protein